MPMHQWKCKKCDMTVEVLRRINDEKQEPIIETGEVPDACSKDGPKHEWEKKLGTFSLVKGKGWGGKGYWVYLLGFIEVIRSIYDKIT